MYFNAISIFLCVKEFYLHFFFFVIAMFISGRMHMVEI